MCYAVNLLTATVKFKFKLHLILFLSTGNLCLLNKTYKIIYIYITQLVAVP